jgi:hypothetical protein
MIDWVGEFNAYLTPYAPYGMPSKSDQLLPGLPEFLYGLSKSAGADQTLAARYGSAAARNGEPFGELGLVLKQDAAWGDQRGNPRDPQAGNAPGGQIDVRVSSGTQPINSPGTCCDPPIGGAATAAPTGFGTFVPQAVDVAGAPSVPYVLSGTAGAAVIYTVTDGVHTSGGSTVLGADGMTGVLLDLTGFNDGVITVTATQTSGGVSKSLGSARTGKSSIVPGAPVLTLAQYVNPASMSAYAIKITGAPGTFAIFSISDTRGLQNADSDIIPTSGVLNETIDASWSLDGPITVMSALYNGNGNSAGTSVGVIKDTVAPVVGFSGARYLSQANAGDYEPTVTTEVGAAVTYVITDGVHSQSDSRLISTSGFWRLSINGSGFNEGAVTLTLTVTDPAGNQSAATIALVKDTLAPVGSLSVAGTAINGAVATTNPTLALTLSFTDATTGLSQMALSTNGGTTFGAAVVYATSASATLTADGIYTIVVAVSDVAGNVSVVSRQVRLDRVGPALTYTITAPTNAGSYDVGQLVTLSYAGSDPDNVSALSAVLDGRTAIASGVAWNTESVAAGNHTIAITARDGLGNTSTTTVAFTVHATADGLTSAVKDGVTRKLVTSSATATQLLSYLSDAQKAIQSGKIAQAKSSLNLFVNYVKQQGGKTIDSAYAALLIGWANDLISRL